MTEEKPETEISEVELGCKQFVGMPKEHLDGIAALTQNRLAEVAKNVAEEHPDSLEGRLIAAGVTDRELAEVARLGMVFSHLGVLKPRVRQ